jgi:NRAMP (natural resistance-associated macrophage protein)-like metal ion transporter
MPRSSTAAPTRAQREKRLAHHHPETRRRSRFGLLKHLGPGLITGAADDDPSGIGTYSQLGAQFGLGMIWTVPLSLPLAAGVEELAARLGLAGRKGLASLIREHFPRPILYASALLVTGANTFNIGADLGAMDASLRLAVPIPFLPLLITITAMLLVLEVLVSYHQYARFLRLLTLSLFAYVAVLAVVHVDWGAVARAMVVPQFQTSRDYLGGLVAIFGTTISPYLMFWQCSEEVEETRELKGNDRRITSRRVLGMRVDVILGMAAAVSIMFAIVVASAFTLGAHGVTNVGTADQAAAALKPLAGPFAGLLFALGVVGTGSLAVPVLAGSTGYALAEVFGWHEGLSSSFRAARGFYLVIVVSMLVGLVMNLVGIDPIKALIYSAALNGVAAPPLILLMILLGNKKTVLGTRVSGRWSNFVVGAACLLMVALPILYLLQRV